MSSVKERKRNQPIVQAAQLYQGTKKLLHLQKDVTFIFIEHKVTGSETFYPLIIEVITYSSSHKYPDQILEAQRLYLSCSKIFEKVNPFQLEKEGALLTPNCSYAQSLIVKYIFGRMTVSEKSLTSSSTFLVEINPLDSDPDQDFKLKPYDITHEGPMILAQLPHIKNIRNEVRMAFDFSMLDSNHPPLKDCQNLLEKEVNDRQGILTSISQHANYQNVSENDVEVKVKADMEVPHVAAVRTATNTFLSFLSRSKKLAKVDQNLPESKRQWHAAVRKIIRQNHVRITKIRLARSMSNTLRREEDHLLKYQHAQKQKEERKESKRKSQMKIDKNIKNDMSNKNDKSDKNERKEESSAASHQLSFPPFFKQLTDPLSNFRPSQLQLQLQLPSIGSIMNFKKPKSAKYSYVEEKETDHEINNEITSNTCNSNKASCGSNSISRLPNLSNSIYSMNSTTDSEHSSAPSSPTLLEREKRQNNRVNIPPSPYNPTNTTHILKSNTNTSDVFLSNNPDNDIQNQINLVDHVDINIYMKNMNYTKELDKSEKINEFIARQKAFERNEKNELIRINQARRCGVSSRSIEDAIDELNLGDGNYRKGKEFNKINNQINNNNNIGNNNNNCKNSDNDNVNNFINNTYSYNGNNNDNVDDHNDNGILQEVLNTENLHNQSGKRCGQIRIKKPFHSFSVSSHLHDSAEDKHYHHNNHFYNNNDNDNDDDNQNNQELLKNNSEIKSRQGYPTNNSKCRFMDQNNSRSYVSSQDSNMTLPPIRIHTAPSLLYNTSQNILFFTPTPSPTPTLTRTLTQNPSEKSEVRGPEESVKIAMISKSRRSILNNSESNNKNKNNNTNKKGSDYNNNNSNSNNNNNNNNSAQSIQQSNSINNTNINTDISIIKKNSISSMKSITRDTARINLPASPNGLDIISHDRGLELSSRQYVVDFISDSFHHTSITPLKTVSSCTTSPVMSPVASPLSRTKFWSA